MASNSMERPFPSRPSTADNADTTNLFPEEKAILKDCRVINLAWFIDIKYRFWTPGEMMRIPKDQQAYYISVLHDFRNILRNIPPIPSDFHHDTSRVRCATDDELDRWLHARQKANQTRGIERLQSMIPSIWQMMEDRSRQNPALSDAQIMHLLVLESAGIKSAMPQPKSMDPKRLSKTPANSVGDKKINKTPKK